MKQRTRRPDSGLFCSEPIQADTTQAVIHSPSSPRHRAAVQPCPIAHYTPAPRRAFAVCSMVRSAPPAWPLWIDPSLCYFSGCSIGWCYWCWGMEPASTFAFETWILLHFQNQALKRKETWVFARQFFLDYLHKSKKKNNLITSSCLLLNLVIRNLIVWSMTENKPKSSVQSKARASQNHDSAWCYRIHTT